MIALMPQYIEDIEAEKSQGKSLPKISSSNSPVCGDRLCSEISNTQFQETVTAVSGYAYKQDFIPVEKVEIDLETTAVFIIPTKRLSVRRWSRLGTSWRRSCKRYGSRTSVYHKSNCKRNWNTCILFTSHIHRTRIYKLESPQPN